ncbi:trafficking protein particle complex subunit 6B [Arabidopsis lyrata subsp. lyrata]|uniref:trafficking protein particle complex subunit 6B n=1 Tax=Arabidopsis lyrata subsp. lyrata TaxID=81972 RepID=UPI000A29ADDF|nr:trafficking protein particle complex subunit 6B [Arabidopsis lyrata subsp. lyrata]|eukprot:XP_020886541.1 trafficking protein particle complex subunit 6B [Arabidopsis lyrata subsp. lyrata]
MESRSMRFAVALKKQGSDRRSRYCDPRLLLPENENVSRFYSGRFYANKPELAARRIEAIGYQVGHQLSERYTMERPRFSDHLEAIKFICKDFWSEVFKKQIDNLKTNHRGTFVLQDNKFRWLSRVSIDPSSENETEDPSTPGESKAAQAVSMYLYFPCGIIRGVLSNLGIPCAVSADISSLPTCSFVIRVKA